MSSAPRPRSMKIGSRPIERIARTGELTPPGRRSTARAYSSAERVSRKEAVGEVLTALDAGVLALPVTEVVREVQEADLLELGRAVQRGAVAHLGDRAGDRVEDRDRKSTRLNSSHANI